MKHQDGNGKRPPIMETGSQGVFLLPAQDGPRPSVVHHLIEALEGAVQFNDLSETVFSRIFDAHRQMIELRAAQKLNAGLFEPDGSVLVSASDI